MDAMAKAGRKPTGQSRPHVVQITFTDDEFEFISRYSIDTGQSTASYGRQQTLPVDWRERLVKLKKLQNNEPLNKRDGRRKNV